MCALPTLYEYYTGGGISAGLSDNQSYFTLNNRNITIFSGALHYFRVPPEYWQDRLRKMRSAGLNAVETYVPWNLHEPHPDFYEFGHSGTDFQQFLDIEKFLKTAREEDLFVIVRPGPYICAEWEFGGLPSWLLRKRNVNVRTADRTFMERVEVYFRALLNILTLWQFTMGGPIIAFQIENEYGNTKVDGKDVDLEYLEELKALFIKYRVVELLFTSDTPSQGNDGSLPGVLYTANFQKNPEKELTLLKAYQPRKPLMVMEYWTGWYDHWTEKHHTRTVAAFYDIYERILKFPASVNMYMFHGGTNFGFMNGADVSDYSTNNSAIQQVTTSYDYDAPLSETGDYTVKFFAVKQLVQQFNNISTLLPKLPKISKRRAYDATPITSELKLRSILENIKPIESYKLISMEHVNQSYGYIVYRKERLDIKENSVLMIEGHVCDSVVVVINGYMLQKPLNNQYDLNGFGFWRQENSTLRLTDFGEEYIGATLDIMVENSGRVNYGKLDQFNQYKGLWQGDVTINGEIINDWKIYSLDFMKSFIETVDVRYAASFSPGPTLYQASLTIAASSALRDTYVDMRGWTKGIVIVNGIVLGRYMRIGPQQTLYLPAPFLNLGENKILVFEHFKPVKYVRFRKHRIYEYN